MDFIERILGFSPDNGSGSLELSFIAAVIVSLTAVAWVRRIKRPPTSTRGRNV
jgi:uncharacterized membrane protein YjjB (DUF3815 family)